jgi:hypothetical protein
MTVPLVLRNHFQIAYVVRDIDKAVTNLREKFGIAKWQVRRMPESAPSSAIGFAYMQQTMIELVEARPSQDTIFRDWLPPSESGARFHHLGYMIDSEEQWRETVGQFEAADIRKAFSGSAEGLLDFYYADTVAHLGHYCELVRLQPAGKNFFARVPHN